MDDDLRLEIDELKGLESDALERIFASLHNSDLEHQWTWEDRGAHDDERDYC